MDVDLVGFEVPTSDIDLADRIIFVRKYFCTPEFTDRRTDLAMAETIGNTDLIEEVLNSFPTKGQVVDSLIEKLKDKSVYKTLKKILDGSVTDRASCLKCLFSLGTHAAIEVEHGNCQYELVMVDVYDKISKLLFNG